MAAMFRSMLWALVMCSFAFQLSACGGGAGSTKRGKEEPFAIFKRVFKDSQQVEQAPANEPDSSSEPQVYSTADRPYLNEATRMPPPLEGVVAQGDRMIGYSIFGGSLGTHETIAKGKEVSFEFLELSIGWEEVERKPGKYSGSRLDNTDRIYGKFDLKCFLGIEPINNVNSRLPKDLRGKPFDHPEVIDRYKRVMKYALSVIQETELSGIIIGNEVEAYLQDDPKKWKQYTRFVKEVAPYIRSLRPDVPIGVKAGNDGHLVKNVAELQELNRHTDHVYANYFPMGNKAHHGGVMDPSIVHQDLAYLTSLYPNRIIHITEIGYPTSSYLGSSEAKQAEFVRQAFVAWDRHADQIKSMQWHTLHDLKKSQVKQMGAFYKAPNHKSLAEYLATGGLRTVNGKDKQAFPVLKQELGKRRWAIR